ncbi:MAG: bifunctional precorrin-2 dehydrogenase/sirohydrochlorin ferrochelatase [Thermodesulfobacteriota bacterium]|nr:MAG: bifunctional precorrin-2 dehydrogenase/sirohydrochlorin ferrochelatase [Candidatus Dadabacteria bacterium]
MVNVNLNINSKKWLIVGGGVVATRRTKKILSSGAIIKIVSPKVSKSLISLESKNKKIKILKRNFRKSDIKSVDFVLACTNNNEVNKKIVYEARKNKVPVSNASNKSDNDFSFTSEVKINKNIKINFSTNGSSPYFSKSLKLLFNSSIKKELIALYKATERNEKKSADKKKNRLLKETAYNKKKNIKVLIKDSLEKLNK